jgi:hypothetical protein
MFRAGRRLHLPSSEAAASGACRSSGAREEFAVTATNITLLRSWRPKSASQTRAEAVEVEARGSAPAPVRPIRIHRQASEPSPSATSDILGVAAAPGHTSSEPAAAAHHGVAGRECQLKRRAG